MSELPPPPAPDPAQLTAQMMADLQQSNPQLAMLAQMMQARTIVPEPMTADLSGEIAELAERLAAAERRIERMRGQGQRLFAAYREVNERLAELAAALGACGLCWGEDDHCPSCRGRGHPGMMRPDLSLRDRLLGEVLSPAAASHSHPPHSHSQH